MKKRYQIQHAHGIRRPREDQGTGGEGPHVHERLRHRLLSRQADRGHRRAKELLRQLKGIGSNINRLTVLANMGKVQVIGLEKGRAGAVRGQRRAAISHGRAVSRMAIVHFVNYKRGTQSRAAMRGVMLYVMQEKKTAWDGGAARQRHQLPAAERLR